MKILRILADFAFPFGVDARSRGRIILEEVKEAFDSAKQPFKLHNLN